MIDLKASVTVRVPIEKVWNFMSDIDTTPQWDPEVIEVKWQRPISVDSIIEATAPVLGRRIVNVKIIDWEPNSKIGMESRSGGVKGVSIITMESLEADSTRLTRSAHMELGGLLKLIQPYVSHRARGYNVRRLENVKRILEAQSQGA